MGAGDDQLTVDTTKTTLNATIQGGEGEDTVVLTGGGNTIQYTMSGFETVSLSNIETSSDTDTTISASNSEGIQNIVMDSTVNDSVSFVNMGSSDITVDANGETSSDGSLTIDNSGVLLL